MYKKILVPLDGSELAEAVLPHAEALAKSEDAEIVLLRVAVTPDASMFSRNPALINNIIQDMDAETDAYVKTEVSKLRDEGLKVSGITRDGFVPETILEVADETHADVIAMSTHGRTGVKRWLMGSVADKVVHYSRIPVMLIHPSPN
ncbi:MAG: universal stress protein [Chloroflexi bacterium]|nr:universal stress protein [Chloroflexota bacterium]